MSLSDQAVPKCRHYGDHRPYPGPPQRLGDLHGPTAGLIELPVTIDWGPKQRYDMNSDTDRRVVYEVVLQEASSTVEISRYVNGRVLAEVWSRLFLPERIRDQWEQHLPELTTVP